ncbi:AAA family ATPase [Vibrio genomosp. F10]|uniref:AAA family ATPase n=1 Tax=Vibrio genomosp. F10 TaxID=723171 RepID=UPI0002EE62F1|nr:AAA family ATPase [Vibrio genomosp. F10]OEF08228.1 hypothetical protein A1QK_06545 [Vibrio genomosp. F10 str. 9ZD137]
MATVSLPLPPNVLHDQPQELTFDKIATFIGGNGSGKSTILKSIFDEKLKGSLYEDLKVVCFSSGQNESYSNHFSEYLNAERAKKNALSLDCFYYDKSLSKLLIFLATTSKHDGLVRSFLKQNNYIIESEFDEDKTTKLSFKVKVDKSYTNLVKQALEDEKAGNSDVITNKPYHQTLNNFINTLVSSEYNFEEPLEQVELHLSQEVLSNISFELNEQQSFGARVLFFTQASDNNFFILKDSLRLQFSRNGADLFLEDFSDGEYQLLFLYALIDIFDSNNTLFLLDEADSHLHYRNIERLWGVYLNIEGKILTTTHLLDSIAKSGISRLNVVEEGQIKPANNLKRLSERLKDLSEINNVKFQAISMFKNVVLIDDENDWEQFKLLIKRKKSASYSEEYIDESLKDFIAVKCHSGYEGKGSEVFAGKKLAWLRSFTEYLNGQAHKTRNVYLVCDRDELPIVNVGTAKCNLLLKGGSVETLSPILKSHTLSWKRREIKHYLLSYTALSDDIENVEVELNLGAKSKLRLSSSGDKTIDGSNNEQLAMLKSKPVKEIVDSHINEGDGFCVIKTKKYINRMPPEEISEDIVDMYNYLVSDDE